MLRSGSGLRLLAALAVSALLLPAAALAGDAAAGKETYDMYCQSCHGPQGKGDGPVGAALNPSPRDFSQGAFKFDTDGDGTAGTDSDLAAVIKNGAGKFGGSPLMAPWGHLSDSDVENLVAFIRSLKEE